MGGDNFMLLKFPKAENYIVNYRVGVSHLQNFIVLFSFPAYQRVNKVLKKYMYYKNIYQVKQK